MDARSLTDLKRNYERDGYVAIEGLLTPEEVEGLKAEAAAIAHGERGPVIGAVPGGGRDDDALMGGILAIHFPHKASDAMRAAVRHPKVVEVLTALIGPDVKAMQTMLFVKRAGKPGQAWHQDEHYIPTRDRSLVGAWIAMDDATEENGCLWMHPGSQAPGVLYPTKPHGDPRFDNSEEAHGFPYEREAGTPVPLKAGGVAFFNGYVLHRSLQNRAAGGFRRALVTHYMSARSLLPWTLGGPKAREDFRDIELVAGEDPYAWRGLEDITFPFVRPESAERAGPVFQAVAAEIRRRQGEAAL